MYDILTTSPRFLEVIQIKHCKKPLGLKYNLEDVGNLVRLKKEIFSIFGIGEEYLEG